MNNIKQLHEQDFNLWVEQTKVAIQNRDFESMDWENLWDEIDDMGKSEKRSLESFLELLIAHILKINYWEKERDRNYTHWKVEVRNFRTRLRRLLKRNPSLRKYMEDVYDDIYRETVKTWQIEFDIPEDDFIALMEIMDEEYFGKLA